MIFSLDPGISAKNATGVALFNPALKRLVAASVIRRDPKLTDLDAQFDIAARAVAWATAHTPAQADGRACTFVTEWPQVYPGVNDRDPNTALLPLCGIIGAVSGLLRPEVKRSMYRPREWKGTIKGDVFLERIAEQLDAAERKVLDAVMPAGLRHNATDAVGIGLKFLGRMGRTRVVHCEPAYVAAR